MNVMYSFYLAPSEASEEEQQKKSARERAREEFYFSIQEEGKFNFI